MKIKWLVLGYSNYREGKSQHREAITCDLVCPLISPLSLFDYEGREVRLICIGTPVRGNKRAG